MADRAKDATGDAQIEDINRTPKKLASEKGPQQQPTPEETPRPKAEQAPDANAGAEAEKQTKKLEIEAEKEPIQQQSATRGGSKHRNNRRRGRNRSKASESEYDSTAERAALGPPNRQGSKSDRSQNNGVPIARTTPDLQGGGSGTESTPETISGGRRNRQGRGQKQAKRVNKQDNLEISGVVNGRSLNGTEETTRDGSESESTAGSTAYSDGQAADSGRRNRRRRKGNKPQANNAPLPSITEDHTGGEREESAAQNGTSRAGDIAGQSGRTAVSRKVKVEVKEEPLRLKLEFNMDIDVEIKAKISGDLTLNMYGKAEFGELKVQLDHAKF
jgi:hypothetical protein